MLPGLFPSLFAKNCSNNWMTLVSMCHQRYLIASFENYWLIIHAQCRRMSQRPMSILIKNLNRHHIFQTLILPRLETAENFSNCWTMTTRSRLHLVRIFCLFVQWVSLAPSLRWLNMLHLLCVRRFKKPRTYHILILQQNISLENHERTTSFYKNGWTQPIIS